MHPFLKKSWIDINMTLTVNVNWSSTIGTKWKVLWCQLSTSNWCQVFRHSLDIILTFCVDVQWYLQFDFKSHNQVYWRCTMIVTNVWHQFEVWVHTDTDSYVYYTTMKSLKIVTNIIHSHALYLWHIISTNIIKHTAMK